MPDLAYAPQQAAPTHQPAPTQTFEADTHDPSNQAALSGIPKLGPGGDPDEAECIRLRRELKVVESPNTPNPARAREIRALVKQRAASGGAWADLARNIDVLDRVRVTTSPSAKHDFDEAEEHLSGRVVAALETGGSTTGFNATDAGILNIGATGNSLASGSCGRILTGYVRLWKQNHPGATPPTHVELAAKIAEKADVILKELPATGANADLNFYRWDDAATRERKAALRTVRFAVFEKHLGVGFAALEQQVKAMGLDPELAEAQLPERKAMLDRGYERAKAEGFQTTAAKTVLCHADNGGPGFANEMVLGGLGGLKAKLKGCKDSAAAAEAMRAAFWTYGNTRQGNEAATKAQGQGYFQQLLEWANGQKIVQNVDLFALFDKVGLPADQRDRVAEQLAAGTMASAYWGFVYKFNGPENHELQTYLKLLGEDPDLKGQNGVVDVHGVKVAVGEKKGSPAKKKESQPEDDDDRSFFDVGGPSEDDWNPLSSFQTTMRSLTADETDDDDDWNPLSSLQETMRSLAEPSPAAATAPSGSPPLVFGQSGPRVEQLQNLLNARFHAGIQADGDFGAGTLAALKAAQKQLDLSPDGVYGEMTANAFGGKPAPAPKPAPKGGNPSPYGYGRNADPVGPHDQVGSYTYGQETEYSEEAAKAWMDEIYAQYTQLPVTVTLGGREVTIQVKTQYRNFGSGPDWLQVGKDKALNLEAGRGTDHVQHTRPFSNAYCGKAKPVEMSLALEEAIESDPALAQQLEAAKDEKAAKAILEKYCHQKLGLDCIGFAWNVIDGSGMYNDFTPGGFKSDATKKNAYNCAGFMQYATDIDDAPETWRPLDCIVDPGVPGVKSGHILVIYDVRERADGKPGVEVECMESYDGVGKRVYRRDLEGNWYAVNGMLITGYKFTVMRPQNRPSP